MIVKVNKTRKVFVFMFVSVVLTAIFIAYRNGRDILQQDKQFVHGLKNVREQFFKGIHKFDDDSLKAVNDICQYYKTVLHRLYINARPSTDEAVYANLVVNSKLVFPKFVQVREVLGVKLLYIDSECLLLYAIEDLKSKKVLYTVKSEKEGVKDVDTYTLADINTAGAKVTCKAINFDRDIEHLKQKEDVTLHDIAHLRSQIRHCDAQLKHDLYNLSSTYSHDNICKMITTHLWLSFDKYKHTCYVCSCLQGPLWYLCDMFDSLRLYCMNSIEWLRECAEGASDLYKLCERLRDKIDSLMKQKEQGKNVWNNLFQNYKQYIHTDDKLPDANELKHRINKRIADKRYSYCITLASYFFCYGRCLCLNNFVSVGDTMMNFAHLMTQIGCLLHIVNSK